MTNTNAYLWTFSEAMCPECSTCEKPIGVFQCNGCGRVFCSRDTDGHRKLLRNDLEELIQKSEQWNGDWNDELRKRQNVLKTKKENVLEQIGNWEAQSMAKIRQAADEAREYTGQLFEHHTNLLPKRTTLDLSALRRAWETDGFLETHLTKWSFELQRLKNKVTEFITDFVWVKFEEPFIAKLVINGDFSVNKPVEMPDIPDTKILTPPVHFVVSIDRDFGPYNQGLLQTGVHEFRYKSKNIFFGITSKTTDRPNEPWNTSSTYGWTSDDLVYRNGRPVQRYAGYKSDFQVGDTYLLVVDCNDKVMRLTNERTNQTYQLEIDPTVCPLPWQLNVRFLDDVYQ